MSQKAGHTLRIVVSLGLAALFLFLFLRHLDLREVGRSVRDARASWLVVAFLTALATIPLRVWRWVRLLKRVGTVRFGAAFSATCIGFAASTLLPARAGEVIRPVALARSERLPLAPLLASIGLERLLDLVSVVVLVVVYALGSFVPAGLDPAMVERLGLFKKSAFLLGAGTFAGLIVFAFLASRPALFDRIVSPFLRVLPARFRERVGAFLRSFLEGLGAIRTPAEIAVIAISSLTLWFACAFQLYATLRAFDLVYPFPVSFFVLASAVIGLAAPTPGGVGGYHYAVSHALTDFYAAPQAPAAALAVVSHAISFVPVTILGLIFLGAGGSSLGRLASEAEAVEETEASPAR
ncbi:MAG TPA: lysylphosphatidylglycerol synthase transmembrane domain-containing protein [Thermoanaerobaculia bacterium]|jgi:hypothetical protein|nr:lysylphosphatidylglycerol synthase transmembrane domain-containing protein [Thermoanaerobaculia bacterium]